MNAITTTTPTNTILALGLGKFKSVACGYERGTDEQVFCCHAGTCGWQGDVIDLWAAARGLSLREAALDLVRTFGLEPAPRGTEKRHG